MPGIQILGAGNNASARVNEEGRLKAVCVSSAPEYHSNFHHSACFYLQITVTPEEEGTFLYIKNESENTMILENLFITAESDETISIYRNPTGAPTGGNDTTPSNSNFGSSNKPVGVFQYASDLGGLTNNELYSTLPVFSGINNSFTFRNWLILPRNSTISFVATTGAIELDISMPFFYLPGEL